MLQTSSSGVSLVVPRTVQCSLSEINAEKNIIAGYHSVSTLLWATFLPHTSHCKWFPNFFTGN